MAQECRRDDPVIQRGGLWQQHLMRGKGHRARTPPDDLVDLVLVDGEEGIGAVETLMRGAEAGIQHPLE